MSVGGAIRRGSRKTGMGYFQGELGSTVLSTGEETCPMRTELGLGILTYPLSPKDDQKELFPGNWYSKNC